MELPVEISHCICSLFPLFFSVLFASGLLSPTGCSQPTLRKWRRNPAPLLGAARCRLERCCLSPEGLEQVRLWVEAVGGCTVCVSRTLETAWPGHPMTPLYLLQREARPARKRGRSSTPVCWCESQWASYLCVCVCVCDL